MKITASVNNTGTRHEVSVSTAGSAKSVALPAKKDGGGSELNGGELLMLALATCYCNDLHREAVRLNIELQGVEVEASAEFKGVGLAATNVCYRARVHSSASNSKVEQLLRETDAVAEVHNTVRSPIAVALVPWDQLP